MRIRTPLTIAIALFCVATTACRAQSSAGLVDLDRPAAPGEFAVSAAGHAAAIYVAPQNPQTVHVAAAAFASDVERVTGIRPRLLTSLAAPLPAELILVGVLGHSPEIDRLRAAHKLETSAVDGKWESALTTVVASPLPGVRSALVVAGSDRRGAAFALFTLSRQIGVSPWTWWADVPVAHHSAVYVHAGSHVQHEPSVQYRGIFLNDEDWGLRPWAAEKMDPDVDESKGNIGPRTYERIFELLLRLHANSLWPAMHPGTLPFNAVPQNAVLADKWAIVMGSSHSEALLRNNVGEWDEHAAPKGNGPWNYQLNAAAMNQYWDQRLAVNGRYENFYTVGLRGVHDSGLEATGTPQVKAKLVEDAMAEQRKLLAQRVNPDVAKIPQVLWVYKESLDLYRVGMKVPDDVTLGWTDDNYGYIRELPDAEEQKRAGGSGLYYHVSYWGSPHDHLWLCTTPPALIREEMTRAYDHNARKYWVLNVGDLKPSEIDMDYFLQLAWDEPAMAKLSQHDFLERWMAEQFPAPLTSAIVDVMTRYYQLNFIRKPEFMGFNGYNDGIKRTAFNLEAWGGKHGQNGARSLAWKQVREEEAAIASKLPPQFADAYFELVGYPIEGSAAMNEKLLANDLTYLDAHNKDEAALVADTARAQSAYDTIQSLTAKFNTIEDGKWNRMMSSAPRERHVFEMPRTATEADAATPLPASWAVGKKTPASPGPGFVEQNATVSINAAHFARSHNGAAAQWNVLNDLGISGSSVEYGSPGLLANAPQADPPQNAPWLEYEFTTTTSGGATLALHLLPTFPVDSSHRLRYAVSVDGAAPVELDAGAPVTPVHSADVGDGPGNSGWAENVLRNSAVATLHLDTFAPGKHTVRLLYRDPGIVFQHIVLTFPGAPPAYPVPPETGLPAR